MEFLCIVVFALCYIAIVFEQSLRIDKAASALLGGIVCWLLIFLDPKTVQAQDALMHSMADISGILFFLLGAMTIVELIDAHDGFSLLRKTLNVQSLAQLVWIVSILTFVLSSLIDNLTTAIVMVSLCTPLLPHREDRWSVAALIIISANAGGAWSPIGDVTSTMLWIAGNLSASSMILHLMLPSLLCALLPTWWIARSFAKRPIAPVEVSNASPTPHARTILIAGLASFACIPVLKALTHLPPFALMLLMLALLWILTSLLHRTKSTELRVKLGLGDALKRIDTPSILFFLGILLSVSALQKFNLLSDLASWCSIHLPDQRSVAIALGFVSAIVDNIPLVAAAQAMYPLTQIGMDQPFWELLALSTATGGSIVIVGSAAGVAIMGMEEITFMWYLRRVAPLAFVSMTVGVLSYLLQRSILFSLIMLMMLGDLNALAVDLH